MQLLPQLRGKDGRLRRMSETVRYKNKDGQIVYVDYGDNRCALVSREMLEWLLSAKGYKQVVWEYGKGGNE